MVHRATVEIVDYSGDWPRLFDAERTILSTIFPPIAFQIEHVGSTAVPGLGAKPIVDLLVGAQTLSAIEERISAMKTHGYQYMPEHEVALPQRRFFAKPALHPRKFHVHAVQLDSRFWAEQLLFRDALRGDSRLAAEYCTLKIKLAARFVDDREAYTDAKSTFIKSVLERAHSAGHNGTVGA